MLLFFSTQMQQSHCDPRRTGLLIKPLYSMVDRTSLGTNFNDFCQVFIVHVYIYRSIVNLEEYNKLILLSSLQRQTVYFLPWIWAYTGFLQWQSKPNMTVIIYLIIIKYNLQKKFINVNLNHINNFPSLIFHNGRDLKNINPVNSL
jgi:hypothetical protein